MTILRSEGFLEPMYVSRSLKGSISNEFEFSEEILTDGPALKGIDNFGWNFHHQVLRRVGRNLGLNIDEFREIEYSNSFGTENIERKLKPQPLSVSTALEIGVLHNSKVPSLVQYLLPSKFSTFSSKYLQKQLICPPPHQISQHFRNILQILSTNTIIELPKMTTISAGKIVSLLSAYRCNYDTFRDMCDNMIGIQKLLTTALKVNPLFANSLLTLAAYESGAPIINPEEFLSRLLHSINIINNAISIKRLKFDNYKDFIEIEELFKRNEENFYGIFVQGIWISIFNFLF